MIGGIAGGAVGPSMGPAQVASEGNPCGEAWAACFELSQ